MKKLGNILIMLVLVGIIALCCKNPRIGAREGSEKFVFIEWQFRTGKEIKTICQSMKEKMNWISKEDEAQKKSKS